MSKLQRFEEAAKLKDQYEEEVICNCQYQKCVYKNESELEKKKIKLKNQFEKKQNRDLKNFQEKMKHTRKEMLNSKDTDFENMKIRFRVQMQQLEINQKSEQIEKEKFLKNFDPVKNSNIEKFLMKLLNESIEVGNYPQDGRDEQEQEDDDDEEEEEDV